MKVIQAVKYFPPPFGGMETVIEELTKGLLALDPCIQMSVLATHPHPASVEWSEDNRLRVERVNILAYLARTPIAPAYPVRLKSLEGDLVHFHFPYPWAELAQLFNGGNRPYIVTYHSDIVRQKRLLRLYQPFMRRFLRGASRVVIGSPHLLETSHELQVLPKGRVEVVPFGITTSAFATNGTTSISSLPLKRKICGGGYLLLFVGRIVYYKGLGVLLKALQSVDAHLAIVGEGPLRQENERLALNLGVGDRVHWLGSVSTTELRDLYQAADLFILPSTEVAEAFGMVQLEAMSCCKPVICTDLPSGVPWVNQHGVTGLVVPPGDSDALASAIALLLADPALRERLGLRGRERVVSEFSVRRLVDQTTGLYRSIAQQDQDANAVPSARSSTSRL